MAHTLRVQETCNPQVPLCYRESLVQVLQVGLTIHLVHVDEHGPGDKGAGGAGRQGHGSSEAPWEGQHTERPFADPRDTESPAHGHPEKQPPTWHPCAGPGPRSSWVLRGAGAQDGVLIWAPCSYPVYQALGPGWGLTFPQGLTPLRPLLGHQCGTSARGCENQQPRGPLASTKPGRARRQREGCGPGWASQGGSWQQNPSPGEAAPRAQHTPSRRPLCPSMSADARPRDSGAPAHRTHGPSPPSGLLVPVDDGVEEAAVAPAGGEVVAAQALVALHHALGPQQQLLLGRHVL